MTVEDRAKSFIEKAKSIKGNECIDYSQVEYVNNRTPIKLIDRSLKDDGTEYGEFWITPSNHLKGRQHPQKSYDSRAASKRLTQEEVIERFKIAHKGENLDYSKVCYKGMHDKVCVIDHDLDENGVEYGEYWMEPSAHLKGCKHPKKCKNKSSFLSKKCLTTQEFINKAKSVHNDFYDYSKVEYRNAFDDITIICPLHGEFKQRPNNHLNGKGCPICSNYKISQSKISNLETWIKKSKLIHGEKYDYSKCVYVNAKSKMRIICPKHGEFLQEADSHLRGHECPLCSNGASKEEMEIFNFINTINNNAVSRDRTILNGHELDIYVPSMNFAIEYNGLRWHSEWFGGKDRNYHLKKLEMCNEKGINLLQIFEDEYLHHKDIVMHKIAHIMGVQQEFPRIMGRKCEIKLISKDDAKEFLDTYHIQGFASSTIYLGAYYNSILVGVMTFKEEVKGSMKWELTRFASDFHYICQGVGGKLFKWFVRNYDPIEIKSFADRRWTVDKENNLYTNLGFELESVCKPDYKYYFPKKDATMRFHKFGFRKQTLNKVYGLPLTMTETEMAKELGCDRIWDCGLFKYVWKRE